MTLTPQEQEAMAFFAKGQSYVGHSTEARHGFELAASVRRLLEREKVLMGVVGAAKSLDASEDIDALVAEWQTDRLTDALKALSSLNPGEIKP
jgi:hypothetical protein